MSSDQSHVIWLQHIPHLTKMMSLDRADVIWSRWSHLTKVMSSDRSDVVTWPKLCGLPSDVIWSLRRLLTKVMGLDCSVRIFQSCVSIFDAKSLVMPMNYTDFSVEVSGIPPTRHEAWAETLFFISVKKQMYHLCAQVSTPWVCWEPILLQCQVYIKSTGPRRAVT